MLCTCLSQNTSTKTPALQTHHVATRVTPRIVLVFLWRVLALGRGDGNSRKLWVGWHGRQYAWWARGEIIGHSVASLRWFCGRSEVDEKENQTRASVAVDGDVQNSETTWRGGVDRSDSVDPKRHRNIYSEVVSSIWCSVLLLFCRIAAGRTVAPSHRRDEAVGIHLARLVQRGKAPSKPRGISQAEAADRGRPWHAAK